MKTNHLVVLLIGLLVAGCVSVKQDPVQKSYWALDVARSGPAAAAADSKPVLRVKSLKISPLYEKRSLVYRTDEMSYRSDFYNEFLIAPGMMFTALTTEWLDKSGLFSLVLDTPSKTLPDYVLEGAVNHLYGDFRTAGAPRAVLSMQLFLIDSRRPDYPVVVQRRYRERIPIPSRSAEDLVLGWNQAYQKILKDFEAALTEAKLKGNA